MPRVDVKPADLGNSGWHEILPAREPRPALTRDVECDYAVIGAGFAGLAAACRLRQLAPDASVLILDAQAIGTGPAGRSSGFMIDLPHALASGSYVRDRENDARDIRMNRCAIDFVAAQVRNFGLPQAVYNPCGKVNAAASRWGMAHNYRYACHLDALDEAYRMLDAGAMRDLCGSEYYRGGLQSPGSAVLQPSLYLRSLGEALVTRAGCELYENSAVIELQPYRDRWRLRTEGGSITTPRTILAVNGMIETFGYFRQRLIHINLYAAMTRKLNFEEAALLGGTSDWGFTPADPIGSTVRRIDGNGGPRLMIRNGCTYEPQLCLPLDRLQRIEPLQDRRFYARFPMLRRVEMEHRWSGRLCLSRNEVWALGEIKSGLFSACCQNGLGATRGTLAGILAAEMAAEAVDSSLVPDYRPQPAPSRLLPEPLMTLGGRGLIRFKEWRAGKEL